MSYQVPQHIDPNKVFLINHSELEGRLDPMFYTRQFSDIIVALKKCSLYKRLGQIASFSSESWNQKDYYEKEFPYIEIGAINITDGTIEDVTSVPIEQAPSRAKVIVRTNDILISTTRPNRGAIVKITEKENLYIASTGFAVIRDVDDIVKRDYLLTVLRLDFTLKQMLQRSTGGNYPAITGDELSKTIIPIPPIDIQNKIVSLIESAHKRKQDTDSAADSLLQSIDDYLLGELGIQLSETKSQTIQDRMFVVNYSDASGERFDPMFYTHQFTEITEKLHNSNICKRLGQIARFSTEVWNQKDYYEAEFPYIEIGAINIIDGTIEDVTSVPIEQAPSRARVIVRTGDIIISTTRPDRGAIIKITENENLYIASTGFSVIRDIDSNINTDYLLAILRHKLILMQMRQRSTGGNYPAITQEELSKIIIPILPLSKQQEIVDHISSIRQQAKALQEEGKAILEQAKNEVERMILG